MKIRLWSHVPTSLKFHLLMYKRSPMKPNPETRIAPAAPGTNTRPPRALPHCFHLPYIQLSGLVRLEQGPSRPIVSGWCTPGAAAAYRGEGPYSRVMFPSADGGPPAVRHVAFSPADR